MEERGGKIGYRSGRVGGGRVARREGFRVGRALFV